MRRRMDGDLKTRFQAPKRVGPPIKNQGSSRVDRSPVIGYYKIMNYKEKLYQTALDIYFKKNAYTAGEVKEAVDIVIGDDGMRSKEVLEVVKKLKNAKKRS